VFSAAKLNQQQASQTNGQRQSLSRVCVFLLTFYAVGSLFIMLLLLNELFVPKYLPQLLHFVIIPIQLTSIYYISQETLRIIVAAVV